MTQRSDGVRKTARGAFTITELLVVMIVITVVISILIPAIGHVRDAARGVSTQGLMNNVVAAASKFSVDHKRQPGYFPARALGSSDNANTQGMSAGENAMLDIAGGAVGSAPGTQPPNTLKVNPTTNTGQDVYVDPAQIGAKGAYFVPPTKFYVRQTNDAGTEFQQFSMAMPDYGHTAGEGVDCIPDLVDAWGHPILFWVEDETAVAPITPVQTGTLPIVRLARRFSPTGQVPGSKFYWASNAAFLKATTLGKKGKNQTFQNADIAYSLIGENNGVAEVESLEAALGNPNFPWKDPANPPVPAAEYPAAGRGPFIVQSAGRDAIYFGSKDRGAKVFANTPLRIDFTYTRWTSVPPVDRVTDKNGSPSNRDVTQGFDDLLTSSAN